MGLKEFAAKEKLEIVLSAPVPAYRSGRQGEAGGKVGEGILRQAQDKFPPADLPAEVSTQAGPSQFRSDIFKQTPPKLKTPTSKLGKNIKRIREQKNMTQGDIARALEVDRGYISNIESGKKNLTLATIQKLADALKVSADELLK